jgi:integrase
MVGYRASVYKHLIPGVGAHRLDKLQPEHLEKLYERMVSKKGLKPATAHLAHRTVRVALNEAVRRGRIAQNPAKIARPPRVEEDEIIPFTVVEAQRLFTAAATARNGARFVVALALGLRRGEALGLRWSDVDITWKHGCPNGVTAVTCVGHLNARSVAVPERSPSGAPFNNRCGSTDVRRTNRADTATVRTVRSGTAGEWLLLR